MSTTEKLFYQTFCYQTETVQKEKTMQNDKYLCWRQSYKSYLVLKADLISSKLFLAVHFFNLDRTTQLL